MTRRRLPTPQPADLPCRVHRTGSSATDAASATPSRAPSGLGWRAAGGPTHSSSESSTSSDSSPASSPTPRTAGPFRFTARRRTPSTGGVGGIQLTVVVNFGAAELHRFTIDLVADLPITAPLDHYDPQPVVEFEAVGALPAFTLYPLPDQVADKVCAMYERHGRNHAPSSRYRDLVDLVVIIGNHSLDAATLIQALHQESTRRSLELPQRLISPAPVWTSGYATEARSSALPRPLRSLDEALTAAATCLDPVLNRALTQGVWDPATRRWMPATHDSTS